MAREVQLTCCRAADVVTSGGNMISVDEGDHPGLWCGLENHLCPKCRLNISPPPLVSNKPLQELIS
jgi:hypothetical protein